MKDSMKKRAPLALGLLALALLLGSTAASAAPQCSGGQVVWDNGTAIGCRYAASNWNSTAQSLCGGTTILSPGSRGDCYVCVTSGYVNDVLNAQPFDVGTTWAGAHEEVFHCLEAPIYDYTQCESAPDMVALWPAGERTDSTLEEIWLGNNGTLLQGARRVFGWIDCAVDLDGTNDYVNVPDNAYLDFGTGDFSIDAWIQTSQSSGTQSVLDKRVSGPYRGWHVYTASGKLGLQLADGNYTNFTSQAFVADGNWHHVAITADRSSSTGLKFYVDGSQVGSSLNPTGRSGSLSNSSALRIGTRSLSLSGFWNGTIDELALHDAVLSPSLIADIANASSHGKCR